ncbi:MAG TPA: YceI family protein [Actinomycetota bacterium]|nr:YceI family protein [Actinomycetota bacterium]
MSTDTAVREIDGVRLPQAGDWVIDPAHSSIEAVARHMVITKVRGRFEQFSGSIHIDEDPTKSWAEVAIKAASINTNAPDRDGHLKSPDFLNADEYPELTFKSTKLSHKRDDRFVVVGDLTIRGETQPVTLEAEFGGVVSDPFGQTKALFSATTKLERETWGMNWNQALEAGGVLVSKSLDVEIEVQAVLQS